MLERVCESLQETCDRLGIFFIFKSSFDKANRSSQKSRRGPGLEEGLRELERIRERFNVPVLTDVHETGQVEMVAEVVDVLQIPAFLSRQTDLINACAQTGKWVNVKKGQFLAPADCGNIVKKIEMAGSQRYLITERGASFGYGNLIFDPRSPAILHQLDIPTVFDGTHSTQYPGGRGESSGGDRGFTPVLMRAAVACGVEGLFMEVHPDPDQAWSDASNQYPLAESSALLQQLCLLDDLVKSKSFLNA